MLDCSDPVGPSLFSELLVWHYKVCRRSVGKCKRNKKSNTISGIEKVAGKKGPCPKGVQLNVKEVTLASQMMGLVSNPETLCFLLVQNPGCGFEVCALSVFTGLRMG